MITQNIVRKVKLINVKVPVGSRATEFYFEDQPDLRDAVLLAICFFPTKALPKTYENNLSINQPAYDQSFITMYDRSGFAFVDKTPISYFQPLTTNNGNIWGVLFNQQKLNWSKCYIHIADNALISITDDEYYQILVTYEYPTKK